MYHIIQCSQYKENFYPTEITKHKFMIISRNKYVYSAKIYVNINKNTSYYTSTTDRVWDLASPSQLLCMSMVKPDSYF